MTKAELNNAVKIKMREKRIAAFSATELLRVFGNVCAPRVCTDAALVLIAAGLTIPELYAPCEPSGEYPRPASQIP